MITNEIINKLIGVDDSYKAPERLMELLFDNEKRLRLFRDFEIHETDLNYEWFQMYFESEHADRKVKKQDFTPNSVSELGAMIIGESDCYFEATAGTGGMMIQYWKHNPSAYFELEELSDRAIPFLLFNMAIRGINGKVKHGDSLTNQFKAIYEILNDGNYSIIRGVSNDEKKMGET